MGCSQKTRTKKTRPKNGGCGTPPQSGFGTKSLSELMSLWKKDNRPNLCDLLDGYRTAAFPDALKAASRGEWHPNGDKAGRRHPHQWRIPKAAIKQWSKQLTKAQARIQSFRGLPFEKLFDFLKGPARTISGIGPLMVYDTALRIGANIGCLPKDQVYLHAHATIPRIHKFRITKSELPKELKALGTLKAHEIEHFLCVYHEDVKRLMSRSSSNN